MENLASNEKKIFYISVIILIIFITITHVVGYLNSNENYYYVGNQHLRSNDIFGHFSFINQAIDGHFLFKNLYFHDPYQKALFFHPLWLMMGLICKWFGLSMLLVYQLFKVILAIIFCFLLRNFFKEHFDLKDNIWLFPFCLFATGFFTWLIEKDTFLILYYSPLFILALILLLSIFHLTLKYFQNYKKLYLFYIFFLSLLLFLVHFYDSVTLIVVIIGWGGYQYLITKKIKNFLPAIFTTIAIIIGASYYFYVFNTEYVMTRWALNNVTLLPSWQFLLIGYGALLPLAIIGAIKEKNNKIIHYLVIWFLGSLYLTLSSMPFNRRLVLGASIPLTILAYFGAKTILLAIKNYYWRMTVLWLIILLVANNNLLAIFVDFKLIQEHNLIPYEKRNYIETMFWMKDNLPKNRIIFAYFFDWDTKISGYTGLISYIAGFTTLSWEDYNPILWFFKDNEEIQEKQSFLKDNKIDYLFYSEKEKVLGSFNPQDKEFLKLIYKNQDAEIYQVIK